MTQAARPLNPPTGTVDPSITVLDEIVPGVPWQDGFEFGRGVDIVTGGLMPSAIQESQPTLQSDYSDATYIRMVRTQQDYQREVDASASGSYNADGLTINGSAAFLSAVRFSETSMTLIASWTAQYGDYDRIPQPPKLTQAAQKLVDNSLDFRQAYGDYFINGGKRESTFFAVYALQAESQSSLTQFNATIGASMPEVFDATASAAFVASASQHSVSIQVQIFMSDHKPGDGGFKDGEYSPADVISALTWFKQNATGVYQQAELVHYSAIIPHYPRAISVPLSLWGKLKDLNDTYASVARLYDACPSRYQTGFQTDFDSFTQSVEKGRSQFAYNANLVEQLLGDGKDLAGPLQDISDRLDFYRTLHAMSVADSGTVSTGSDDDTSQSYGYSQSPYPQSTAIQITAVGVDCSHEWESTNNWTDDGWTIDWSDQSRLITGFAINNNWGGYGYLNVAPNSNVLLSTSIHMAVYPDLDRGCSWTMTVYTVDASDYDFATAMNTP